MWVSGGPFNLYRRLKNEYFGILFQVSGMLAIARPFRACKEIENVHELAGHIIILERGDCMFVDKVCWLTVVRHKLYLQPSGKSTQEILVSFALFIHS